MARIQSPVIGRAKGQAGGMVFTTLNGQNVMKAKAYSYRDQNTLVQQENRAMARTTSRLAASLKGIARSLFVAQPQDMPAYSKLIQQFQARVNRSALPYSIGFSGLVIGSGSFDMGTSMESYQPAVGDLVVSWNNNSLPEGYDAAAPLSLIVIDAASNSVVFNDVIPEAFADAETTVNIPPGLILSKLHATMVYTTTKAGADLQKNVKIFS